MRFDFLIWFVAIYVVIAALFTVVATLLGQSWGTEGSMLESIMAGLAWPYWLYKLLP